MIIMDEKQKETYFERKHGKIIVRGFATDSNDFKVRVFEAEQYLNDKVATYIFKKFRIGIRFHI